MADAGRMVVATGRPPGPVRAGLVALRVGQQELAGAAAAEQVQCPPENGDGAQAQFRRDARKTVELAREVSEVEKPKKPAPVVDLMAALKQSLAQMEGKKKPAATVAEADVPARKRSRK